MLYLSLLLKVPDGKYIKLKFPKFMVSTGSPNCPEDSVQIVGKRSVIFLVLKSDFLGDIPPKALAALDSSLLDAPLFLFLIKNMSKHHYTINIHLFWEENVKQEMC